MPLTPAEKVLPEPAPEPPPPVARAAPQSPPKAQVGAPAAATGLVRLVVVPWGEVYVDGQKHGVAPPLRAISLKPGKHRIEIRNPGFESYLQVVDVGADQEIRIRHRFE